MAWGWIRRGVDEKENRGLVRSKPKLQGVLVQLNYSEILCTMTVHPCHLYFSILPSTESLAGKKKY